MAHIEIGKRSTDGFLFAVALVNKLVIATLHFHHREVVADGTVVHRDGKEVLGTGGFHELFFVEFIHEDESQAAVFIGLVHSQPCVVGGFESRSFGAETAAAVDAVVVVGVADVVETLVEREFIEIDEMIAGPFPYVASHVVKTELIGLLKADRMGCAI